MILGKIKFIFFLFVLNFSSVLLSEDKIISAPLINLENLKPSFEKEDSENIVRRPSTIVMKYMQEFGYEVIPVNPFSVGKKIYEQDVLEKLEDIIKKFLVCATNLLNSLIFLFPLC